MKCTVDYYTTKTVKNKKEGDNALHYNNILVMCYRVISPFYYCSFTCVIVVLTRHCKL